MPNIEEYRPEKIRLINWLATPKKDRKTQEELAEEIGVTSKTIWEWKKDNDLMDAVLQRKKEVVKSDDLIQIIDAVVEKAKKGNIKQVEFLFEWLGEIESSKSGQTNIQVNVSSSIPRSEDEIIELDAN